jgi:O-acetyl-ADP-ribose deacetylase (regulator of RNase III)
MTEGRALLLGLMRRYLAAVMDPTVTLLEIHKLMYFMQESGQPLKLHYAKGPFGPYAENLRQVLTHIEGHFIVGYGDAADQPDKPIEPKASAVAAAEEFLADHPKEHERFDRVVRLIEGFETPFGMELLSTVHWAARHENAKSVEEAVEKVYAWNDRKRMFRPEHVRIAWKALHQNRWLDAPSV